MPPGIRTFVIRLDSYPSVLANSSSSLKINPETLTWGGGGIGSFSLAIVHAITVKIRGSAAFH